jgi:hypothetical protein
MVRGPAGKKPRDNTNLLRMKNDKKIEHHGSKKNRFLDFKEMDLFRFI